MPGRYAFHGLLRAYAAEQAAGRPDEERAAIRRLLDHYLHTAHAAHLVLYLGRFGQARTHCQQAIDLCRSIGYSPGEAGTWDTLGFDLARALTHLGDTYRSTGDLAAARSVWAEALAIMEDLHHLEAAEVRAKLDSLSPVANSAG